MMRFIVPSWKAIASMKSWRYTTVAGTRIYALQAMNTDAERKAIGIRCRAERREGQFLKEWWRNRALLCWNE
jgi:hypothetical protein